MQGFILLKKPLGKGSYGQVQLCQKVGTQDLFAIKTINLTHPQLKKLAPRQVQIMKILKSQSILKYHSHYMDEKQLKIVTEYCQDGSLRQLLQKRLQQKKNGDQLLFAQEEIWRFTLQIMNGLFQIHRNGIIHGDIKPENIFLKSDANIKIGDFGCSQIIKPGKQVTYKIGTEFYLSPEIKSKTVCNQKADIWSLGCTFYRLISGENPFYDPQIKKIDQSYNFQAYIDVNPRYSYRVTQFLKDCLKVDLKERPSIYELFQKPYIKEVLHLLKVTQFKNTVQINSLWISLFEAFELLQIIQQLTNVKLKVYPDYIEGVAKNIQDFCKMIKKYESNKKIIKYSELSWFNIRALERDSWWLAYINTCLVVLLQLKQKFLQLRCHTLLILAGFNMNIVDYEEYFTSLFNGYGEIEYVQTFGCQAIVIFKTEEDAERIIDLFDNQQQDNQMLEIRRPNQPVQNKQLYFEDSDDDSDEE